MNGLIEFVPTCYSWDLRVNSNTVYTFGDIIDCLPSNDLSRQDADDIATSLMNFCYVKQMEEENTSVNMEFVDDAIEVISNELYRRFGPNGCGMTS